MVLISTLVKSVSLLPFLSQSFQVFYILTMMEVQSNFLHYANIGRKRRLRTCQVQVPVFAI